MTEIQIAGSRLRRARLDQLPQPAPDLADESAACEAQEEVARSLGWFGGTALRHWKSGLPLRANAVSHAPLPTAGVWDRPETAGTWHFALRGIEAEAALRLRVRC